MCLFNDRDMNLCLMGKRPVIRCLWLGLTTEQGHPKIYVAGGLPWQLAGKNDSLMVWGWLRCLFSGGCWPHADTAAFATSGLVAQLDISHENLGSCGFCGCLRNSGFLKEKSRRVILGRNGGNGSVCVPSVWGCEFWMQVFDCLQVTSGLCLFWCRVAGVFLSLGMCYKGKSREWATDANSYRREEMVKRITWRQQRLYWSKYAKVKLLCAFSLLCRRKRYFPSVANQGLCEVGVG